MNWKSQRQYFWSWSQTSGPCGVKLRSLCSKLRSHSSMGCGSSHGWGSGAVISLLETHGALASKTMRSPVLHDQTRFVSSMASQTCSNSELFVARSTWATCWTYTPWEAPNLYSLLNSKVVYFCSVFSLGAKLIYTDPSGVVETMQSSL